MFWAGVAVGAVMAIVALFTYCTLVVGKKSENRDRHSGSYRK